VAPLAVSETKYEYRPFGGGRFLHARRSAVEISENDKAIHGAALLSRNLVAPAAANARLAASALK